jgi:hypothetical protein
MAVMVKLLLAVCAVASLSFNGGGVRTGGDDDEVAVISINPNPPSQGGTTTVSYSGQRPRTLTLSWTGTAGVATIEIPASGSATLNIPKGALAVKLVDPSGDANALWTIINP